MSYVRQGFADGDVLNAEKLIKMEDGILERIKAPAAAAIGQTIRVSAVDEDGKPTEWEAVEFTAGGNGFGEHLRLIADIKLSADNLPTNIEITEDMDGNPISMRNFIVNTDIASMAANTFVGLNDSWNDKYALMVPNVPGYAYFVAREDYAMVVNGNKTDSRVTTKSRAPITKITWPNVYKITSGTFFELYEVID